MLNIFKNKTNNKKIDLHSTNLTIKNYGKDFPSSDIEWNNSVYFYNKTNLALVPEANKTSQSLIRGFLDLYNLRLEEKVRRKNLSVNKRNFSFNRIFVNRGEFKHTNDKVLVNLFIYNKQKNNLLFNIKKNEKFLQKSIFSRHLKIINKLGTKVFIKTRKFIQKRARKIRNKIGSSYISKTKQNRELQFYNNFIPNLNKISYTIISDLYLKRLFIYLYYKQLVYLNKSKFEYSYVRGLLNILDKVFNKTVELNIVNLKHHYLNSDIFTEPFFLLLTNRKKKRYFRFFTRYVRKIKVPKSQHNYYSNLKSLNSNVLLNKINTLDPINNYIYKYYLNGNNESNSLKRVVLDSISYKKLNGVRLQLKGRYNKSSGPRSSTRIKYKGNLRNDKSSFAGIPTVLLRGNFKSNLQYTYLTSSTRVGSFGLKGWVSGK